MKYYPYIVAAWILFTGLYGIVTSRHLVHLIISLLVVQSSTYIMILAVGFRHGAGAPIFYDKSYANPAVDPVGHALALTDIVVGATVTALLLAIVLQIHRRKGTVDPDALKPLG